MSKNDKVQRKWVKAGEGFEKTDGGYRPVGEGYQPFKKGYRPEGNLDTSKPPQGGSGVPPKGQDSKKDSGE